MPQHNEENERIKRRYFTYLREARRYSEASVEAAAMAIDRFDTFHGRRSFKAFHRERAVAFKRKLADQRAARSGEPLSKSTLDSTLRALVAFFSWLADQPEYRSRFTESDAEHFNLSLAESRAGRAQRPRSFPTLEQVHHVLASMPHATDIELRDRALIALTLLTGARDGALRSLRLKHVQMDERCIDQNPREVATKFSKQITTWFFPVGGEAETIVRDWTVHLHRDLSWGPDDPLFPKTLMTVGKSGGFEPAGLDRGFWSTTGPVRRIFHEAFEASGQPYCHPHAIRHTISKLGTQLCSTPEQMKAWSQNLGHDHVLTTLTSYGSVPSERQADLIRAMNPQADPSPGDEAKREIEDLLNQALKKVRR
jgi:integrase